jgi:tRNA1Val (adenine37-N6)-methyltransferase
MGGESDTLSSEPAEGETLDSICGGRIELLQRRGGYRFNLDALILAHFAAEVSAPSRGPTIELGTGIGVVALVMALKFGREDITALEIQPRLRQLAERNVRRNRAERRIQVVEGDLRASFQTFQAKSFAHVVCNPPYRPVRAGHVSTNRERAIARHEILCSANDVAASAEHLLRDKGGLSAIYPAARLCELLEALRSRGLEPKMLRVVHPRAQSPAKLALVHGVKGGKSQLHILPPLVLHEGEGGDFSPEVQRMLEE